MRWLDQAFIMGTKTWVRVITIMVSDNKVISNWRDLAPSVFDNRNVFYECYYNIYNVHNKPCMYYVYHVLNWTEINALKSIKSIKKQPNIQTNWNNLIDQATLIFCIDSASAKSEQKQVLDKILNFNQLPIGVFLSARPWTMDMSGRLFSKISQLTGRFWQRGQLNQIRGPSDLCVLVGSQWPSIIYLL